MPWGVASAAVAGVQLRRRPFPPQVATARASRARAATVTEADLTAAITRFAAATAVQTATAAGATATATVVQEATAAGASRATTVATSAWTEASEPWFGRIRTPSQYEIGFRAGYQVRREYRPPSADPLVIEALFILVNDHLDRFPDDVLLRNGRDLLHSL